VQQAADGQLRVVTGSEDLQITGTDDALEQGLLDPHRAQ
jgi:hypothetical protein